jgi:2-iminobutanoate/2-iminopropanoate deaminase
MNRKITSILGVTLFLITVSHCTSATQETSTTKKQIKTATASDRSPFSQGIEVNGFLFLSGTLGIDAATGTLAGNDVVSQLTQIVANISDVLKEAGYTINDVVKATVFLTDMKNYAAMNEAYLTLFAAPYPARTCVEVSALPREGALIEVEVIAAKPCS